MDLAAIAVGISMMAWQPATRGAEIHRVVARGREYFYWQPGRSTAAAPPRVALPHNPASPEFWEAIRKAQGTTGTSEVATVNAVIDAYLGSVQFGEKSEGARHQYEYRLRTVRKAWGSLPPTFDRMMSCS
jgi:hypothetical protein